MDSKDGYLIVNWFPPIFGEIFSKLWQDYIRCLINIDRNHPYAFISFHSKSYGEAYTLNAFHYNYAQGLRRLGLIPSKANGLSPHSHRHSYGRRLRRYGVGELEIKKCLHHASLESQVVYTTPSAKEVSESLKKAFSSLNQNHKDDNELKNWSALLEHGFNDIDPNGLFSGKSPKLGKFNEA